MTAKLYRLQGGPRASPAKGRGVAAGDPRLAYQLYIELEWVRPKVWRRFLIPSTIELPLLHVVLLWGMGWQGGHVHEFIFADANYGLVEPGHDLPDGVLDEEGVTLGEALGTRKTFIYLYDWGDNWRHKVKVEQMVTLDEPLARTRCIDGANACPPEDIGGAPGYEEFLEALRDSSHPEHRETKEWIGGDFDPAAFDIAEVNARLNSPAE
ncbi:MAG: plasmid pRiA4b ORF-3 family protein [Ramlibacter sp.]